MCIYIFFLLVRNSWCTVLITFRYDKAKNLSMNSTNMIFKGWNRSPILRTWFLDFEWYSTKVFYYKGHIGNLQKFVVTKYAKNCYGENCFIQNHFNPNAELIFTHIGRVIDIIKTISLLFSRQEFDNLQEEEKLAALCQHKQSYFLLEKNAGM